MCDPPRDGRPGRGERDGLTDIVVELSFDRRITLAGLAAIERSCAWCFETHRVQLVRAFLSRDHQRAILVFRAPDAESVRLVCRHVKMRIERLWPCHQVWTCGSG